MKPPKFKVGDKVKINKKVFLRNIDKERPFNKELLKIGKRLDYFKIYTVFSVTACNSYWIELEGIDSMSGPSFLEKELIPFVYSFNGARRLLK